jgi:hypothetical protein
MMLRERPTEIIEGGRVKERTQGGKSGIRSGDAAPILFHSNFIHNGRFGWNLKGKWSEDRQWIWRKLDSTVGSKIDRVSGSRLIEIEFCLNYPTGWTLDYIDRGTKGMTSIRMLLTCWSDQLSGISRERRELPGNYLWSREGVTSWVKKVNDLNNVLKNFTFEYDIQTRRYANRIIVWWISTCTSRLGLSGAWTMSAVEKYSMPSLCFFMVALADSVLLRT